MSAPSEQEREGKHRHHAWLSTTLEAALYRACSVAIGAHHRVDRDHFVRMAGEAYDRFLKRFDEHRIAEMAASAEEQVAVAEEKP